MPAITIKCPVTDRLLPTGISVESLDTVTMENNAVGPCPHCGGTHVWSIRNGVIDVR